MQECGYRRVFCIKPTGWVAFIDASGVIAECSLIAFGPTALRFAETEMFFWSLDTTRLDCVHTWRGQNKTVKRCKKKPCPCITIFHEICTINSHTGVGVSQKKTTC